MKLRRHPFLLFTRPESTSGLDPMVFTMSVDRHRPRIRQLVVDHGGHLIDPKEMNDDGGAIHVTTPGLPVINPRFDTFSTKFIEDCVEANELMSDVAQYRLNAHSLYEPYDPMDLLQGRLKWTDVRKVDDDGEIDSDFEDSRPVESRGRQGGRMAYTREEQKEILQFIIDHRAFNSLRGAKLWQLMERKRLCGGIRSWQSMKEHFRKQMMKQIDTYDLEEKYVLYFQRAIEGEEVELTDLEDVLMDDDSSSDDDIDVMIRTRKAEALAEREENGDEELVEEVIQRGPRRLFNNKIPSVLEEFPPTPASNQNAMPSTSKGSRRSTRLAKAPSRIKSKENLPLESPHPSQMTSRQNHDISTMSTLAARQTYTHDEDGKIVDYIKANKLFGMTSGRHMWEEMAKRSVVPNRTWQSLKNRYMKTIEPKLDRRLKSKEASSTVKGGYTKEEDLKILRYILDNRRMADTNGNTLWKLMEERKVLEERSWQSMKERFRKRIRNNLASYALSPKEMKDLK